jgi:predicted ATP-grasp superfamily ATP-dependent carboligase
MHVFVYEHLCGGALGGAAGAASLRREGLAMLSAVLADLGRCPDTRASALAEPGLCDELRPLVPSGEVHPAGGDRDALFRRLARGSDFTLVIAPEFDGILLGRCAAVVAEGGRLLGPSPAAVRLTADKLALAEHLLRHGVPTPPTRPLGPAWPGGPVVCKPRFGAGSQWTALLSDARAFDAYLRTVAAEGGPVGQLVAQPFVPGRPASVAFLAGPAALLALRAAEQTLAADGSFSYLGGRLPLPAALQERAWAVATRAARAVPGLAGYFGVDVVLGPSPEGDRVIEINPRLTTSYVGLRRLARGNLMHALLSVASGRPPPPLAWYDDAICFHADGRIA